MLFERKARASCRAVRATDAVLSALTALLAPSTAHAAAPAPAKGFPAHRHAPSDTITLPVRDALAALAGDGESRSGYSRDQFKHWTGRTRTRATRGPRSYWPKPSPPPPRS
ncbi:hypothetical protein ACFV2U_44165 [Streptomyces sp. NPDC059697]|uniref:hypothetical protein n=1 Tax=Streptomyces sp. NPDC059697 TaxID=3346912 RepID=UPI0036952878